MIAKGWSVRVMSTGMLGVVTRVWTNEATGVQLAEVASHARRWSGRADELESMLPREEQIAAVRR